MKLTSVMACGLFALAASLPFQPWAPGRASPSSFEIHVESDESGLMTLFYDMGHGFTQADSAARPVFSGHPGFVRFPLPSGRLHSLRLEILDRGARMSLSGARIVDGSGTTILAFGPAQIQAANQMDPLRVEGDSVLIRAFPEADHPEVVIALAHSIVIRDPFWWSGIAITFAVLVALLAGIDRARRSAALRIDERASAWLRAACAAPGRSIMAAAACATLAANYPVIFAGKSLVSPGLGAALLYGKSPWVPGFQSTEVGDSNLADVGALLWQNLPYSVIEHRALFHDGELPLWNRYNSGGTALLAQGQSCFGDPLQVIPLLADGAAWSWDLKLVAAKWLFSCGIGFCIWRLTRHLPVSLVLAASSQFIGFFVYRVNHPAIFSLCYSPWILYCWLRIVDASSYRGSLLWMAGLIGANLSEMCSGTVKEAYILLLWMNFSGACVLLLSARPARKKATLLCALAAAGGLFAMIGSPAWLTFYRALGDSFTSYDVPHAFQIQPGLFAGLFDEAFYRPFQALSNVIDPSSNFLILTGLLWCAVRWRSTLSDRRAAALSVSSVPLLMIVFGVVPPALIERVPFLGNIIHVDNTFSCALIVIFALLSGFGWREAWQRLGSPAGRREGLAVLVLLVLVYASYLGTAQTIVRSAYAGQTWGAFVRLGGFLHAYGLSLVAACAALMWVMHRSLRQGALTPAAAVCAVISLGALHWRMGLELGTAFPAYVVVPSERVDLQTRSPSIDAILAQRVEPFRAVGFIDNLFPGWSSVYDVEGISGPDALMNRYYRELMEASGIERLWDWRYRVQNNLLRSTQPLLDFLNVRFYLDYPVGRNQPADVLRPFRSADMEVFESPSYWPRAFFTDRIVPYRGAGDLWSLIRHGDGRPFAAVQESDLTHMKPAPAVTADVRDRGVAPAGDYALTNNTTSFTVTASGPGIIVLTEAYERGNFEATVNGKPASYIRVNHAFKGILVDAPGTYRVRYAYWPRDLSVALCLAASGIVLALLGIVGALRLKREADPAPVHI